MFRFIVTLFLIALSNFVYANDSYAQCTEQQKKKFYNQGWADGIAKGRLECASKYPEYEAAGYQKGYNKGKIDGYQSGNLDGYNEGYGDGYTKGKGEIESPTYQGLCAYVFRWDGTITLTTSICSNETQCDDYDRNTLNLCILAKE